MVPAAWTPSEGSGLRLGLPGTFLQQGDGDSESRTGLSVRGIQTRRPTFVKYFSNSTKALHPGSSQGVRQGFKTRSFQCLTLRDQEPSSWRREETYAGALSKRGAEPRFELSSPPCSTVFYILPVELISKRRT